MRINFTPKYPIAVFLVVLSCSSAFALENSQVSSVAGQANDHPEGATGLDNYTISAGDKLNIQVYREQDLSGIFAVDDSGKINYPLLGSIQVQGLSGEALKDFLTQRLAKDYIVDPQVQVDFEKSFNKSVIILGHISKPATYPFTPDMTIVRLVSEAGGFDSLADPGKIRVVRTEKDGVKKAFRINFKRIMDAKDDDVKLEPGDLIVIPETLF